LHITDVKVWQETEWRAREALHRARFCAVISEHRARRSRGEKHPVYDFLFEYYSFRPSQLERWSPGWDVELTGASAASKEWCITPRGARLDLDKFPLHRIESLRETIELLDATSSRAPQFGCFGLHEWAMIYRSEDVRHSVGLRLSQKNIASVLEEFGVRCSHFDAFRFFTSAARPLNVLQPTREAMVSLEQPGCIHATMDLYKWAYKFYPWIPSDLLGDAFELALSAREIDMRASPYDLSDYGFAPICIETEAGRHEYAAAQCSLANRAQPIRARLIEEYRGLLNAVEVSASQIQQ
jgi:hypothetical protein